MTILDELPRYNRLASRDELLFLLFTAIPLSEGQRISDLKDYCVANHFSIGRSFDATLKLLEFIGFIDLTDNVLTVNAQLFNPAAITNQQDYLTVGNFFEALFVSLMKHDEIANFIKPAAIKRNPVTSRYYVKDNLIPIRFFPIRNLLISLGFFQLGSAPGSGDLIVQAPMTQLFEKSVVKPLRTAIENRKQPISVCELKQRLHRLETLGEEAEIFVLSFEKRRLQGHPFLANIRRISEAQVNAGFDIESFNDSDSVFLDRFIEVKSFSGRLAFYWSRNEIQTARNLAENYFLYLVNRDQMAEPGYVPMIIDDPCQTIIDSELWNKEPETWMVSAESP